MADDYRRARAFFGFSASEVVRGLPEDCSYARVAEEAMVRCWESATTFRTTLDYPEPENKLHIRKSDRTNEQWNDFLNELQEFADSTTDGTCFVMTPEQVRTVLARGRHRD